MGGIKNAYVIEFANVSGITVAAGVVTGITKVVGKFFRKYEMPRGVASAESPVQANEANGSVYFNHSVKVAVNNLNSQLRNEIILLAKNRLMVAVEDANGKFWLFGRNIGLFVSTATLGTGTNPADRNGADIEFTGAEPEPMIEIDSATAGLLQTPGA